MFAEVSNGGDRMPVAGNAAVSLPVRFRQFQVGGST